MLFSSGEPYLIEGNGVVNGLDFLDSHTDRLLACRAAALHRLRLDGSSSRFRIGSVDVDGMYANVEIDKQKNLNLSAIGSSGTSGTKTGSFDIGRINIGGCTISYPDDSLLLPVATAIKHTHRTVD